MVSEQLFRWLFTGAFLATFAISGYFRSRARRSGEALARRSEGGLFMVGRFLVAGPLYLSMLLYMLNPAWMAWGSVSVASWVRLVGGSVAIGAVVLLVWVLKSLGRNVSETFLTKSDHVLVSHGPYRWVRHPLYSVASLGFLSLSVLAANWFMMGMTLLVLVAVTLFVVPREEAELIKRFGAAYSEYMKRTGRFIPRR